MARIARQHGLWLHVDAAMAGSAMILPECRWMWDGIEGADSLVVNPHKWLGAAFDCSLYYVRDPEHLVRVHVHQPELPAEPRPTASVKNLRDWGMPLGRRFRALKLWFLIREQGVERLAGAACGATSTNAQWLAAAGARHARLARARAGAAADAVRAARARPDSPARRSTATRRPGPSA